MKIKSSKTQLFLLTLTLSLLCVSPSWASGGSGEAEYYFEHTLHPILIKEKLCVSINDCIRLKYASYAISLSGAINFYSWGITDERIIKEIFLSLLGSGLRIERITFWRKKKEEFTFVEDFFEFSFSGKPLLEFIDHTGGK